MRVLVCGGRDNWDHEGVGRELSIRWVQTNNLAPFILITGGANGIDSCALQWAMKHNVKCELYPAEWKKYGKRAGPVRNTQMIVEGKPDLVIAFPGGRGTADMIRQACAAGIKVEEVK
jgi:predicted Rossmann-fold nucleotide-binding protein